MSENPVSGRRPYEGRDEPPQDAEQLPGEEPLGEDEQDVHAPGLPEQPSGHSTRAADRPMSQEQGSDVPGSASSPSSGGPPDAGTAARAGAEQDERAEGQ